VGAALVSNVSDTARWVAVYRAWESERADALFKDPFAAKLAGERGLELTKLTPREVKSGWPLAVRTRLIDDMLLKAVAHGCDCIVNLGAGFDARPYRLALPQSLHWVEADFGALLDEKEALLADERPRCSLQRERLDLADSEARRAFLDRVANRSKNALVLSEGFAVYLEDEEVRTLGRDLLARPSLRWWLVDFFSPGVLKMMKRGVGSGMDRAPLKFAPAEGLRFFEALGFRSDEVRSIFGEASRLGRAPWPVRLAQLLPEPDLRALRGARWAGVVRFERGQTLNPGR